MSRILALLFALITASVCLAEAPPPLLLQHPTLNATQIAFVYAGELWIVPREGGVAKRLTSGVGTVSKPSFSADGTEIAFTGEYNGNSDVYIIPAGGGVPRRITYHPAVDSVVGWTRDGKQILFASNRNSYDSFNRLFTISRDGGFPTELPFPIGAEGSYSPDGSQIAYVPLDHAFEIWKRYRGGRTSPIWIAQLKDSSITKIPRDNSNDFNPLWVDHRIFFLSDRQGPITLFSYDTRTKSITKVLKNDGFDFKYASAGPGALVIEQFGSLYLYDLKSGKDRKLDIRVEADLPEMRAHFLNVAGRIEHADISPTGKRAVFEARGEILTVPAEKGDIRNITNTPGVDERSPAWSPNGDRIAYFSDESGEYALHIKNQNGLGEVMKIDLGSPGSFFFVPFWSPDGKKIAYADKRLNIWYVDLENKKPVKVFSDRFAEGEQNSRLAWSPDSKWLAYTQQELSHMRSVFLYSLETGQSHRVTDGMSDSFSPVFDKSGKYLYLLASTDDGPTLDGSMMSMNRPVSSSVYITVLRKDLPSPLAPESDEETGAKPETPKGEGPGKATPPPVVKVDFEKIGQRILALPLPAQHYLQLQPGKEGSVFIEDASSSMGRMRGAGGITVSRFDLKTRKAERVMDGLSAFIVSANSEKMLYRTAGGGAGAPSWFIASIPNSGGAPRGGADAASGPKALNTVGMEVRVDPPVEWRQMYHEAFRLERDFFYDGNFHGLDLKAAEKVYEPYLAGVASRGDLNYIFREAFGNITVGHMYVVGGETPPVEAVPVGLLGADYRIENGRYRFSHIFDGENWNPQLRAPLTQPGVNVNEGDYLLAVNGRDVSGSSNIFSFFEMTANQSVVLRVGPDPSGAGSREVTVVPVASEAALRKTAWVEGNRRKVDQLSRGKLAYIYLPDTSMGGYASFNRYFFSQAGKQGAVVDERFNHGGINTDYILDYLRRTLMNFRTMRDGEDTTTPVSLIQGPKAMIINEYAGSGGDAMPFHFRQAHIGLLVGKRTWGGLVGFAGPSAALMDGGSVTAPSRGFWTPNNAWEVENHGVAPDVEVDLDPHAVREGHDPQLEKTVDLLLQELAKHPIPVYHKPPYPNYHQNVGKGMASPAN